MAKKQQQPKPEEEDLEKIIGDITVTDPTEEYSAAKHISKKSVEKAKKHPKIALGAVAAVLLAIGSGAVMRSCESRSLSRYQDSYRTFQKEITESDFDQACVKFEKVLGEMRRKDDPDIKSFYTIAYADYTKIMSNRSGYISDREKRDAQKDFSRIQQLFNSKKYKESYQTLQTLIAELEKESHLDYASPMRDQVMDWEEETFLPTYVDYVIALVKKRTDHRANKKTIDDLVKFVGSKDFQNKTAKISEAKSLHSRGISAEDTALAQLKQRLPSIRTSVSSRQYYKANTDSTSLLKAIDNAGFVYKTKELASFRSQVQSFYDSNIRGEIVRRNTIKTDLTKKFKEYDRLLKSSPISSSMDISKYASGKSYPGQGLGDPYIRAEQELARIYADRTTLHEDPKLRTSIGQYHTRMIGKCKILQNEILEYFQNQYSHMTNEANKGNLDRAKTINATLSRQMTAFKRSTLANERYE